MTREQMAAWLEQEAGMFDQLTEPASLLEIAAYLRQSCATCQHADTAGTSDGWCLCAAPSDATKHPSMSSVRFPFRYKPVPLDERCKGWTAKESD